MIKSELQAQLRGKYNPDGSKLRDAQLCELEILKEIDSICRKHNIKYWLSSGTLLGAVRHSGFIPWDDDVDIEMLRSDYDRFIEIFEREADDKFALQTYENEPNYTLPFAKVRDKATFVIEEGTLRYKYNGYWVDVFPIEYNNLKIHRLSCILHQIFLYSKIGIMSKKRYFLYAAKRFVFGCLFPICRLLSKLSATKQLRHTFGIAFYSPRDINDIFPLAEMNFENYSFFVPSNYDAYLRKLYGDYMTIPESSAIINHNI